MAQEFTHVSGGGGKGVETRDLVHRVTISQFFV